MSLFPEHKYYRDGSYSYTLNLDEKTGTITGHTDGSAVVTLPQHVEVDGVTFEIRDVGILAFSFEPSLEELVIPDGYRAIGLGAFSDCPRLRKVTLGKDFGSDEPLPFLPRLGGRLGCWSVDRRTLEEVVISPDKPHIRLSEDGHFILSKNGRMVLATVRDDRETLSVPEGVTDIALDGISRLGRLERIILPGSLRYIDDGGIAGNELLREIILPEGVRFIGTGAFASNQSLRRLHIPASVTSLWEGFAAGCGALEELIICCEAKALRPENDIEEAVPCDTCTLWVPDESVVSFRAHPYWKKFKKIFPLSRYNKEV